MLTSWWKRLLQRPEVKRHVGLLKLGPRSRLVLAKLGFDMRASYDDLLKEPLPESHTSLHMKSVMSIACTRAPERPAHHGMAALGLSEGLDRTIG